MNQVIIGVDPTSCPATIEVLDCEEQFLGSGRFTTDRAGYTAMRTYVRSWPDRVWAVEGANGAGRPLAQRLLESGEHVVDVPAKLAARVRLFDTGHNRKTDALDAHSVAVVAVRTASLRVVQVDGELEALRMLTDRREALTRRRVQTVCRPLDGVSATGWGQPAAAGTGFTTAEVVGIWPGSATRPGRGRPLHRAERVTASSFRNH